MALTSEAAQSARTESTVHEIVSAIAEQTDTDVLDLPPLNDSVDTDALTALLRSEGTARVEFEYVGHTVVVDGDGRVRVTDEA